jgi:hypothetical protein
MAHVVDVELRISPAIQVRLPSSRHSATVLNIIESLQHVHHRCNEDR